MRHVGAIAGREIRSMFLSPVAYVVLTLWSLMAGTFFLSSVFSFQEQVLRARQLAQFQAMSEADINLNAHLITPFIGSMWVVLLFLLPAVTMGLFANEKSNGTEELLMTSPVTIWEIVFGKFLAGAAFAALMTGIGAFFPGLLFVYGDPEVSLTLSALLGLLLVSVAYVAVGAFASSLTKNQLIAFILTLVLLLLIGMMLPFIVELSVSGSGMDRDTLLSSVMGYVATGQHFENLLQGLVLSSDLVYFAVVIGVFLLLTKTVIESARWR